MPKFKVVVEYDGGKYTAEIEAKDRVLLVKAAENYFAEEHGFDRRRVHFVSVKELSNESQRNTQRVRR